MNPSKMAPASDVLSPLAAPFYPSQYPLMSNGMPVATLNTHEAIRGYSDQAIDEVFPPSAADAAEMDDLDDFLAVMVDLSFIEDREEKGRNDLGCVTTKRWETKRKEGLKGKPHLSYGSVERVIHENTRIQQDETRLVTHRRHVDRNAFVPSNRNNVHYTNQRNNSIRYTKHIQQPRKHN